jgi:hypothetical protein
MNIWMVRAGEGGRLAEEFSKGYVAVGWNELGDMTTIKDREDMRKHHLASYPTMKKGAYRNDILMFHLLSPYGLGKCIPTRIGYTTLARKSD